LGRVPNHPLQQVRSTSTITGTMLFKSTGTAVIARKSVVDIKVGDIFWGPQSLEAESKGIETSLVGKAFGHMVLVLGKRPDHEGHWRIMTVSLNTPMYITMN
jgi:hypothetical protein